MNPSLPSSGARRLAEWWARPLFVLEGHQFLGIDVTLGTMASGEWPAFERDLAEHLASASEARRRGRSPSNAEIDEAATAFRYEHDLISVEDLQAWLDQSGLSFGDWTHYLEWSLLRQSIDQSMDDLLDAAAPSAADLVQAAFVFGVCSQRFQRLQESFARRVALVPDLGACVEATAAASFDDGAGRLVHAYAHWLAHPPLDARARAARALALESAADAEAARLVTTDALTEAIERYRLEWQVIETDTVVFASEAEAREALLCVIDEGMSLHDVARLSKRAVDRRTRFMDELDAADADQLMSVAGGTVVGPVLHEEGVALVALAARSWPSLDDPRVYQRARQAVVEAASLAALRSRVVSPAAGK